MLNVVCETTQSSLYLILGPKYKVSQCRIVYSEKPCFNYPTKSGWSKSESILQKALIVFSFLRLSIRLPEIYNTCFNHCYFINSYLKWESHQETILLCPAHMPNVTAASLNLLSRCGHYWLPPHEGSSEYRIGMLIQYMDCVSKMYIFQASFW